MTIVSIHLLQNHAPSNLNRDDMGNPKDCLFGSVRRARISSQALKRSIRKSEVFQGYFADYGDVMGVRTQLLPQEVKNRLDTTYAGQIPDADRDIILEITENIGKSAKNTTKGETDDDGEEKKSKGKGKGKGKKQEENDTSMKTGQLMFLTAREIDQLTDDIVQLYHKQGIEGISKQKWNTEEYRPHAVDIAMFGRMTTSSPFKNIDAAVQVAHAISTHGVETEFDYYTAVDDLTKSTGAGHIGETAFNSATYYKYVSVFWERLYDNLSRDIQITTQSVRALVHTTMMAIPTGKQNSFAAHNPPDVVIVEVNRQNVPLSYANAFVKPVRVIGDRSLVELSAAALQSYILQSDAMYGMTTERAYLSTVDFALPNAVRCATLQDLLSWIPIGNNTSEG